MPRIITQNRIPRINLANRNIVYAPGGGGPKRVVPFVISRVLSGAFPAVGFAAIVDAYAIGSGGGGGNGTSGGGAGAAYARFNYAPGMVGSFVVPIGGSEVFGSNGTDGGDTSVTLNGKVVCLAPRGGGGVPGGGIGGTGGVGSLLRNGGNGVNGPSNGQPGQFGGAGGLGGSYAGGGGSGGFSDLIPSGLLAGGNGGAGGNPILNAGNGGGNGNAVGGETTPAMPGVLVLVFSEI